MLNHIDLCEYPGANRIGREKILFLSFCSGVKGWREKESTTTMNSNRNFSSRELFQNDTIMEF